MFYLLENITNPKSLSEIATESTSKLSAAIPHDLNVTKTSTPKYLKLRDKILDEDSNESFSNIRPAYRQLNMNDSHKADDSLGFLTEGLCNLGLDESREYILEMSTKSVPLNCELLNFFFYFPLKISWINMIIHQYQII